MSEYHISVLLNESIENLKIRPDGYYVDATYGAGGHSKSILHRLNAKGRLYAFDQDADSVSNLIDDDRLSLISANFRYLRQYLRLENVNEVDGILADLGVSSHQLDEPERGFSYRFNAPLDMRMNSDADFTAADLLNSYCEADLVHILSAYGEIRNSKRLAAAIVAKRKMIDIRTTFDFNEILDSLKMGAGMRYFSQVYQALRIEVNDEMGALKDLLTEGVKILKPGGRFVVITFHSIEDRIVKNFFKAGNFEGKVEKNAYGHFTTPFHIVNKKVIVADDDEQNKNIRSRSAKLRVIEKKK